MQSIFKNPLADPGFLGVNQAAGFGAALAILFFQNSFILKQISAFFFGLLALGLTIAIASRIKTNEQYALVLSGIAISAFFSAFLGILKYAADPLDELPSIVYWLLGSNSGTNWQILIRILPLFIICFSFLYLKRWRINAFSIDKNVQFALGVRDNVELYQILIASVLLTTTIVSFSGIIGWVGLIIPNMGRLLGGQDVKKSMVLTALMGGVFVLICDTIARTALAGEIPLGILTSLVGASAFLVLLVKSQSIG